MSNQSVLHHIKYKLLCLGLLIFCGGFVYAHVTEMRDAQQHAMMLIASATHEAHGVSENIACISDTDDAVTTASLCGALSYLQTFEEDLYPIERYLPDDEDAIAYRHAMVVICHDRLSSILDTWSKTSTISENDAAFMDALKNALDTFQSNLTVTNTHKLRDITKASYIAEELTRLTNAVTLLVGAP